MMNIRLAAIVCAAAIGLPSFALGAEKPTIALKNGSVATYELGDMILHAYQTGDPLADECFVLETADKLIAVESPPFAANIEDWKNYLAGKNKPLTDVFLSYHPNGGKWFGNATTHATESAQRAITGGGTKQLVENLHGVFGDSFNTDIPLIDGILVPGENIVGGVEFEIIDDADGYDIAIPAAKAVYLHMLGANVHSLLVNLEHMDATIAKLEGFRKNGYAMIISGHHTPETMVDADIKIAYIRKVKEIALGSANKNEFIRRIKTAYPSYAGENYLDMTASALFAE
ncbi:MAG: hypothetical protein LBU64_08870 [Planctomycetota bacterium]|jgi:hypothetical protein|nr:hypothetical protein [Planctomycetota bacterium]